MEIFVAGAGKLANELAASLVVDGCVVIPWRHENLDDVPSIVVHAGSGRELEPIMRHCAKTRSVLIELATGSALETARPSFPVVLCPNTNVLMLKFMRMLELSGTLFSGHRTRISESHQSQKNSVPGTAVSIARSLGVARTDIHSIRDKDTQMNELGIPASGLDRHAYHRIEIEDEGCRLSFESFVHGDSPYVNGVSRIVDTVRSRALEDRCYPIMEFIESGWL